jgi:hypothetical protein
MPRYRVIEHTMVMYTMLSSVIRTDVFLLVYIDFFMSIINVVSSF